MSEEAIHVHLHLDSLTINVVHTMKLDPYAELKAMFQSLKEDFAKMSKTVQEAIDALAADLTAETSVTQSAVTLIQGIPTLVSAAVADALAAGATPAQLAAFDTLNATLAANTASLASAVTANTPAPAPAPAPAPTPAPAA